MGLLDLVKKNKAWTVQLASYDYFQLELEYTFKKSGSKNDVILESFVEAKEEKDNPHDPNAVAIYAYNLKIGYLPAVETNTYKSLTFKTNPRLRLYYFNEKYRAEFSVDYKGVKK